MNAVIYARYSSSSQREESIERQIEVCSEYAKTNNYTIINTYIDRALSGRTDKRPAFRKMIEDSKFGLFSAVIVYRFDRFSRRQNDSIIYECKLEDNNVIILSALEKTTNDPQRCLNERYLSFYGGILQFRTKRKSYLRYASKCKQRGFKRRKYSFRNTLK